MVLPIIGVVLVLLVLAASAAVWEGRRRWHAATADLRRRLQPAVTFSEAEVFSEAELRGLPSPVARYFRAALREGQPIIRRARILWQGEFNMGKPGKDNWKPFTATQDFVPGAPGFLWDARIAFVPGIPVLVCDGFVEGAGSMRGAVLGVVPVVSVEGTPEVAAAALQRYLGEAAWFPTALLPSQGVTWVPIDDERARATISAHTTTVSLEFSFGQDGLIASVFAPDRTYDDGTNPPVPRPWMARILRYEERHGMKIPAEAFVAWQLPDGPFQYWRGRPEQVEYETVSQR